VNGYWMCDIGRFDYHWIESDDRLRRPLVRTAQHVQEPATWDETIAQLKSRLNAAGEANPDGVRFLVSAHASHEEFFLFQRLTEDLIGPSGTTPAVTVSWRVTHKEQPAETKFTVPAVDAPNVAGARAFGFVPIGPADAAPDVSALRSAIEAGQVSALYVFDPGRDGTIGDTSWIVAARESGRLPLLIVQGVLLTELARAADFVLPGASSVEKEASYTNDQGRLQGTARAMAPPGDAMDDWQILVSLGQALGVPLDYGDPAQIRRAIAERVLELAGIQDLSFSRAVSAQHWLQSSNPSERWKWDFMFQDLPPVKFEGEPFSTNFGGVIPLSVLKSDVKSRVKPSEP
jgi:predicted molibdopterin-dependent oxidoreductase YjgC